MGNYSGVDDGIDCASNIWISLKIKICRNCFNNIKNIITNIIFAVGVNSWLFIV